MIRAADSYRKAFLLLADRLLVAGGGDNEDFRYVFKRGGDALHLSDAVIDAWWQQLGRDIEDDEASLPPFNSEGIDPSEAKS